MVWQASPSEREYNFALTRPLTGIQSCAVSHHSDWRLNNWLDLRVEARFGRHRFVILFSLLGQLTTGNNIVACMPFLISTGYIRLVSLLLLGSSFICSATTKRVVVLKDEQNKGTHESSAQVACEAAASIRTVASLTREEDCLRIYSERLEEPLRDSVRTTIWSNLLYAFSQSATFYVIALGFWYGARLVSYLEIGTMAFFVSLMVRCLHTAGFER